MMPAASAILLASERIFDALAAGREAVAAADARAFLEMDGLGEAVLGEHLVRDPERLLEADAPAQAMPANLQEDLVSDVVVRADEQPGEDLRKGARLAVNVDRLQAVGHGSGRDLALDAAAGPLEECGDQFAGILQAHHGVLGQADATATLRAPCPDLADSERRDRGLLLAERTVLPLRTAWIVLKLTASAEFSAS